MTGRQVFEYAVLRAVPRIERGEAVNVGVVVYCRSWDFLSAGTYVDADRLLSLDPAVDVAAVRAAVAVVVAVCAGGPDAGPAGEPPPGQRFRWLTAPRSTVVQPGPVHSGLTSDPAAELEHLVERLVR